mgnify:CR=1 FL=1
MIDTSRGMQKLSDRGVWVERSSGGRSMSGRSWGEKSRGDRSMRENDRE